MYKSTMILAKWLSIATILGLAGGISAVALKRGIALVGQVGLSFPLWLAPVIGGLLVAVIARWDKNVTGNGTDRFIRAVNKRDGFIPIRSALAKLAATAATLGFNGSGGLEGPILVIGGSLGNTVARTPLLRRLVGQETRLVAICGAAGALGAVFHSPLGGGIFVVELAYRSSLHYADLFPAMLSSTMGYVVYSTIMGGEALFSIPYYQPSPQNILWFIAAGVVGGLLALLFIYIFKKTQRLFKTVQWKPARPVLGGFLTGLILLVRPEVAGTGLDMIQELILNKPVESAIILLIVAKIVATSFTVGSGQSGGLVIPSLLIGALGGSMIARFAPGAHPHLDASLVVAGMTASLAGVANVPISAAVILSEMAGLQVAIPATIGSVVGYAVAHSQVIYESDPGSGEAFLEGQKIRNQDLETDSH